MTIAEMTERVHMLGSQWEQFRQANEQRLCELERKGNADPLLAEQLDRIGAALDETKQRLDAMEISRKRPNKEIIAPNRKSASGADEDENYRSAFNTYLRKGLDTGLEQLQSKALSVGSDPDGGYLVTPSVASFIIKAVQEGSPLRKLARVETISSDSLEIIDDHDMAAAGWTTETGAVTDTATPQIAKRSIPVHEMYAQPKATQKLVDDAAIDIEGWIAEKVADIFARRESAAFISGSGAGQPRGLLTYSAGTAWGTIEQVNSGSNGVVTADGLMLLYYALKEDYANRATFLMNRSVVQSIRLLKEATTNQYLWQPGLAAGVPDTLLGVPVAQCSDMPAAANGSLSVAVADFSEAYLIVDRTTIRILRDPYTEKPFVKFYTTRRVGGDVVNFEAIKLLKLSA